MKKIEAAQASDWVSDNSLGLFLIGGLALLVASCASAQSQPIAASAMASKAEEDFPIASDEGPSARDSVQTFRGAPTKAEPIAEELLLELGKPVLLADGQVELLSYVTEEIAASPESPEAYPSGSGVTLRLRVLGSEVFFSDLSEGYDSARVAYANGLRVELLSHNAGQASAVVRVFRVLETEQSVIVEGQRVLLGETLRLEPGFEMRFLGHGHKRTYPGQVSPLIVYVRYEKEGQSEVEASYNLFEPHSWTWQEYKFDIVSHSYNENMVLRATKLALEPVVQGEAPQPSE